MPVASCNYHLLMFSSLYCGRNIDITVHLHTESCDALMFWTPQKLCVLLGSTRSQQDTPKDLWKLLHSKGSYEVGFKCSQLQWTLTVCFSYNIGVFHMKFDYFPASFFHCSNMGFECCHYERIQIAPQKYKTISRYIQYFVITRFAISRLYCICARKQELVLPISSQLHLISPDKN